MMKKFFLLTLVSLAPACTYKKKSMRDMNYQELKAHKESLALTKDIDGMIKFLEKMIPICQDPKELRTHMLELADLLFNKGKLEAAEKLYREYSKLFPSDQNGEYALYKAILCSFYRSLDTTRDQTKTEETLVLLKQFIERQSIYTAYLDEVKKIHQLCNERLAQAQLNIIRSYIQHKRYQSAQHRISSVRKIFLESFPALEVDLLHCEYIIAQAQNNISVAQQKKETLNICFPEHPITIALSNTKKSSLLRRF